MRIKILTLNIWDGGRLMDPLIAFVQKEEPDIVFFQEVYNGQDPALEQRYRSLDVLQQSLAYPQVYFAPAFLDTTEKGDIDQGSAIFSQYPLQETEPIFFDVPYGPFDNEGSTNWEYIPAHMIHAKVSIAHTKIDLFNVHGIWGLDGADNERRLHMSTIITDAIKGKEYVIMGGDCNVLPNTQTIKNIEQHLTSVFSNTLTTTFNMKRKDNPGYATAAVDMLFVSKQMNIGAYSCPDVDISDHMPLVATIEI